MKTSGGKRSEPAAKPKTPVKKEAQAELSAEDLEKVSGGTVTKVHNPT